MLEHPRQDFQAALHVMAPGPSHQMRCRVRIRKKMGIMLTIGEQRELCQIEQDLKDADRGFAWRLTLLQDILRWAAPGGRAYLPVLALLAAALLRLVAAAGRLLMAVAEEVMLMGAAALMARGGTAWPGWEPGQVPAHKTGPAQDRPQPDGTDPR